ncbi:MAG TPA: hypothetical protein VFC37_03820 [Terracidiphilus sp.]|nr:hypothetical protein [Terracidiphilus sp.]
MKLRLRSMVATVVLCAAALTATPAANAQTGTIVSKSEVAGILIAIVATGAAIVIVTYVVIHHGYTSHNITGCVESGAGGLVLENQGDQPYALVGAVTDVKQGERVHVSGKKEKKTAGATRQFQVDKLSKDYGACPMKPAVQ